MKILPDEFEKRTLISYYAYSILSISVMGKEGATKENLLERAEKMKAWIDDLNR